MPDQHEETWSCHDNFCDGRVLSWKHLSDAGDGLPECEIDRTADCPMADWSGEIRKNFDMLKIRWDTSTLVPYRIFFIYVFLSVEPKDIFEENVLSPSTLNKAVATIKSLSPKYLEYR